MNEAESLIEWWRTERDQVRTQLKEKAKNQPLSEVETMILNPYTLEQARNQVIALNRLVGDYTGKKR